MQREEGWGVIQPPASVLILDTLTVACDLASGGIGGELAWYLLTVNALNFKEPNYKVCHLSYLGNCRSPGPTEVNEMQLDN